MLTKIVVLFAAVSVVYSQGGPSEAFCQEKLGKEMVAAKKALLNVYVNSDYNYANQYQYPCTIRCVMTLTDKDNVQENYGVFTAPNYTRCGQSQQNYCLNGECVIKEKNYCRDKLDKEVKEMMEKKGMYPLVNYWANPHAKPCEISCNMTTEHKAVTKIVPAPDYATCGVEDNGLTNLCKAGKCQTPDGKTPKKPGPSYIQEP